jgi:hypothetical protein
MFIGKDTFCVVTDIVSLYTKSYATRMQLILPSWIHKCVAAQSCLPFKEEDLIPDNKFLPSAKKTYISNLYMVFKFFLILGVQQQGDPFTNQTSSNDGGQEQVDTFRNESMCNEQLMCK